MEPLERWEGPGRDKSDQEAIPGVAGGSREAGELWGGRSQSRGVEKEVLSVTLDTGYSRCQSATSESRDTFLHTNVILP